jgi:predicted acylesterase/phospholipase RssA
LQTDYTSLAPDQVADLRRKLESAGIKVPPAAATLDQLEEPIAAFRQREGIVVDGPLDQVTWRRLNALSGSVFAEVLQNELDLLRPRPEGGAGPGEVAPADHAQVLRRAHAAGLTGLAMSGGGLRSAIFNLGVLQALGEQQLLRDFDYLSTVSGGGFIGGWLSKCIHERHGDVRAVESMLTPGAAGEVVKAEPVEIQFLRQYSNYLAPRAGVFSADNWTLIGIYMRNTGLNLTMLLSWLGALLLLPRFAVWAVNRIVGGANAPWAGWSDPAWMLGTAAFLFAVFCIALSISSKPESSRGRRWFPVNQGAVLWYINFPLLLSGFLVSIGLWRHGGEMPSVLEALLARQFAWHQAWLLTPGLIYFVVWACGWYLAYDRTSPYRRAGYGVCAACVPALLSFMLGGTLEFAPALVEHVIPREAGWRLAECWGPGACGALLLVAGGLALPPWRRKTPVAPDLSRTDVHEGISHFLSAMVALTFGTLLLLGGLALLPNPEKHPILNNAVALTGFGMPLMMTLFSVTTTLMIGLIGALYSDASREWWSRQGAWTSIFTIAWLMVFGAAFFLPPLVHWAWLTWDPLANIGTALGWAAMTWIGLKAGSGGAPLFGLGISRLELAARGAPYVFTLGIFAMLATLVQVAVAPPTLACRTVTLACVYAAHASASLGTSGTVLAVGFGLCLFMALLLGWRVDINKFSLYMLYRNRLVRAYFGASSAHRKPHPFTGFDPNDDPQLADLQDQKPYHVINTSLNLVGGEELAWQTRKAASFSFTPRFCGFETPQMPAQGETLALRDERRGTYRPTRQYASKAGKGVDDDAKVRLGMAIALSGAAASPNMGSHSSPSLSFLMTMFNARLGRWCPNPRKARWKRSSPPIGLFSLIAELFGMTNADANYVYLSDGGHFENLGVYELVRRRCRLIVAIDVASDRHLTFDDLGNAIRKCATDLHVTIELDVSRMEIVKDSGLFGASCAAGTIRYSHVDEGGLDGTILYIKPAIVGDENADLIAYRKANPDFPHQSTADQWFDEAQFESYRALGYHIARNVLSRAAEVSKVPGQRRDVELLCAELVKQHTGRREQAKESSSEQVS